MSVTNNTPSFAIRDAGTGKKVRDWSKFMKNPDLEIEISVRNPRLSGEEGGGYGLW